MFGNEKIDLDDENKNNHPFIKNFKSLWADNGDLISIHYV